MPKAMGIKELKQSHGDRLPVIGNIYLGYTLTLGTPEVGAKVPKLIRVPAPSVGYIVSSSNLVPEYVQVAGFRDIIKAAKKYGEYPISA